MMASLSYLLVVLRSIATCRRAQRMSTTVLQSMADRTEARRRAWFLDFVSILFADSVYTGAVDGVACRRWRNPLH